MSIRILALSSALLAAAVPAGAQQFNDWLTPRAGYAVGIDSRESTGQSYRDTRQVAYDNGYREGLRCGENAARGRRAFDLERERDYRNGDSGYNRNFGDRDRYRESFRSGFAEGYRISFSRYGYNGGYSGGGSYGGPVDQRRDGVWNYPGSGRYPGYGNGGGYAYGTGYAFQNGVNDGYQRGRDDARDRKYPDYARQKWYRSGDRHYDDHYGSREAYRVQYRRGFQEGYDRAYRELRRW